MTHKLIISVTAMTLFGSWLAFGLASLGTGSYDWFAFLYQSALFVGAAASVSGVLSLVRWVQRGRDGEIK